MSKKNKQRKPRPSAPDWYWLDSDGCWDCYDRNHCNSCHRLKIFRRDYREKKDKEKYRYDS